jgi:hypothetical protein
LCIVSHISGLSNAIYGNLKQKENILQMKKTTKDLRYGGLKGHASQHPIGRRLPCHSCSNSVEHPRISQRSYTIQTLRVQH